MSTAATRRFLSILAASVLAVVFIGCRSNPGPPTPGEGAYEGPPITIESAGVEHVLVAELPSPGFTFTLDQTDERYRERWVFATIRRPNPTIAYPQVVVTQRLASGVATDAAIRVFVRIVDYDDRDGGPEPVFAGSAEPRAHSLPGQTLRPTSSTAHRIP